jgi:TolA-binding protein
LPATRDGDTPGRDPARMNEYELEEIKREIVESRSLTIKTNNLVNALAADLKSIAKRQQGYERRFLVNSATAYVVTIAILFVLLKFAWDAKLETVRAENKSTRERLEQLEKDLKAAQAREEATLRASRKASEFYDLVTQDKRREVVESYPEVKKLPLTRTERAVFDNAVERAKNELSLIAYQTGLDHIRTGRWHEAQQMLRDSLKYKSDAAHSPQATLQLAAALRSLGRQREAIPMLMQLSEASADKEVMDEATLLLAQCQLDIQAWNDAKNTLRAFIRRFPNSSLSHEARMKLAEVQLYH